MEVIQKHWFRPIPFTVVITLAVFGWLLVENSKGILSQSGDEMLTAERSREMLLLGRSAVHFNFSPSFEKPPLQYWLTSLTLTHFSNKTLAVRIWPWLYGLLTVAGLGWLAATIGPRWRSAITLSVVLLLSTPLFLSDSSRGLLDTGLAFFTTIAIAFSQLARRNPIYWVGTGVACVLGSFQKLPLPFLVWFLVLIVRFASPNDRPNLRTGWLAGSIVVALILTAIWPVVQTLLYDIPFRQLFQQEVVDHLGPTRLGANPYFEIPYRFVATSASGLFLVLAPVVVLIWRRANFTPASVELAIVTLLLLGVEILSNFRNVRYIEPIIPIFCLLLAIVLDRVVEHRPRALVITASFVAVLFVASLIQTELQIRFRRKDLATEQRVAEELGRLQAPRVATVLVKAIKVGNDLHFGSFYLFHGNLRFPITKLTVDQLKSSPPPPPVVGVCVDRDLAAVRAAYPETKVQFTRAQFVIWRVD